jgi:hypothetical protein
MRADHWFRALLRGASTSKSRRRRRALQYEALEQRSTPATLTVTTSADTIASEGAVSLREAILSVNGGGNFNSDVVATGNYGTGDTINFNIPGSGVRSIAVGSDGIGALPTLVRPMQINGYTQPGSSGNSSSTSSNAVVLIELHGANAPGGSDGLVLATGSAGSSVRGLAINRFRGHGIIVRSNANTIAGNFIGTAAAGNIANANTGDGIRVTGASNNIIGGAALADSNVVAGNHDNNILISGTLSSPSTLNAVQGNFIGVTASGTSHTGVTSRSGVKISGGVGNTILRNVIGFNLEGVVLNNGAQFNIVQGNFIGLAADGLTAIGNTRHGVVLHSSGNLPPPDGPGQPNEPGVSNNTIGGTALGAGNVIANNGFAGIAVFGNPDPTGQPNLRNAISGNGISNNGRSNPAFYPGIDLSVRPYPEDVGITANDSVGHFLGVNAINPNNSTNAPVLTGVTLGSGGTTITGTLTQSVSPNSAFRIEFYASRTSTGVVQGEIFLGFGSVTTNASGTVAFTITIPVLIPPGFVVTATATDANNNTSEFSRGFSAPGPLGPLPTSTTLSFRLTRTRLGIRLIVLDGSTGRQLWSIIPFRGFYGRLRVIARDMNLDGAMDIVVAQGAGGKGLVSIIDGQRRRQVALFAPLGVGGNGVLTLGATDINGDSTPDVIIGFTRKSQRLRHTYDGLSLFAGRRRVLDTKVL